MILDLIPSKTMKKALQDENRIFTDSEKASIIFHCSEDFEERDERLKKIQEATSDEKLKKEIAERYKNDKIFFDAYRKNNNDFVFVAKILEKSSRHETGYEAIFSDYDDAVLWCKDLCTNDEDYKGNMFRIEKFRLHKKGMSPVKDDEGKIGCVDFSRRGFPCSYWMQGGFEDENWKDRTCYEAQYISLPNPFEFGDRVKIVSRYRESNSLNDKHKWYIAFEKEDWLKLEERIRAPNDLQGSVDWVDTSLPITYGDIKDYGKNHEHINPIYLEKI